MDSHHFDQIARTLATSSRRWVLRLLVAAAVSGSFVRRQATASATPCGVPVTPVPDNVLTGSCQDLSRHRETTGVKEEDGRSHPTWTGATRVEFEMVLPSYDFEVKRKGGRRCAATKTKIAVKYRFKAGFPKVYRLDGQPSQPTSQACQDKIAAWVAQVEGHECRHVDDAKEILAGADRNDAAKPKVYAACAATTKQARQKVKNLVAAAIKAAPTVKDLEDQFEAKVREFHQTDAGKAALDPDCEVCGCGGVSGGSALNNASCEPCCQTCGAPGCSGQCNGQTTVCTFDGCCCHDYVVVRADGLSGCGYRTGGRCGVKDPGCPP
ncbi:MAG: hypothetical protein M3464_18195 [Chloroflexota bacterium]|nr:hypothetical protein [Chloroflexota bacterium]